MSRSERLLDLIQLLRRHRQPVSGSVLADELGISLRTLYRDIATLQTQGAHIDGAPGLGYLLRGGFVLPPLMFGSDEIEALVLGSRWVAKRGDPRLAAAARDALAKIAAVLPAELRQQLDGAGLLVGPGEAVPSTDARAAAQPDETGAAGAAGDTELATVRRAIREECKLTITYRDSAGGESARTIWPLALGFFDRSRVVVAWCELRQSLRHFRSDRIVALQCGDERYPRRRQALLKEWRAQQNIAADRN